MKSGISSGIIKLAAVLCALALAVFGCSPMVLTPHERTAPRAGEPGVSSGRQNPRSLASLRLTEEARLLLEEGKPDEAIRILERAVNLHPANGRNYYYLAEAWLQKGETGQAEEFNRLAEMYLRSDPEWSGRVRRQSGRMPENRP